MTASVEGVRLDRGHDVTDQFRRWSAATQLAVGR
jgi:hypothetical protein